MNGIEEFAEGGTSSGKIRWEPYLEKAIEQYVESNSVLRQSFLYRLNGTYTANLPKRIYRICGGNRRRNRNTSRNKLSQPRR